MSGMKSVRILLLEDAFVTSLAMGRALEAALPDWRFIHTHVGFGYRFAAEPSHRFHISATDR